MTKDTCGNYVNTYRKMLKQPRPEDVGRHFGKDTPLLLILLTRRIVVFLSGTLAAANTRVTRITCDRNQISLTSSADSKPKLEHMYLKSIEKRKKKRKRGIKTINQNARVPPFESSRCIIIEGEIFRAL